MKNLWHKALLIFLLMTSINVLAIPNGEELVAEADKGRGVGGSFSTLVKVDDFDGAEKKTGVYQVFVRDNNTSLVNQLAPERMKGRKLLMRNDDLWLFTPTIRRPVRVSLEQRMTGEVSNGDLARTNYAEDYQATSVEEEKLNGVSSFRVQLKAKRKNLTYSKIDYWIDAKKKLPLKAQYYALSGKLLKVADYLDFKKVLGRTVFTKIVISDALQPKKKSVLIYSKHKRSHFDEGFFNKESLEQQQ